MRGAAPDGAQIEYVRRCSTPSTTRRSVSDWPGVEGEVVAQVVGDVEGDRGGVVGERLDLGDA